MVRQVKKGRAGGDSNYGEYLADTSEDLNFLPTNKFPGAGGMKPCSPGSMAYVTATRKKYILDCAGTWRLAVDFAAGGGGGGSIYASDDGAGNVFVS